MGTIVEDVKARIQETRDKIKARIEEWKERGWKAPERASPRLAIVKEIREKGLVPAFRGRRERRIAARRHGGEIGRRPTEIEPAFPKDMLVKKEEEVRPTVGKREIAPEL